MAISGDYSQPVTVNGYSCKNCTDVDYAKKHIDPAHPKDGPYGIDADPKDSARVSGARRAPSVSLGGRLADLAQDTPGFKPPSATGSVVDLSA